MVSYSTHSALTSILSFTFGGADNEVLAQPKVLKDWVAFVRTCSFANQVLFAGEASCVEEFKHLRDVVLHHEQGAGATWCIEKLKQIRNVVLLDAPGAGAI